jgi:hypothetical protein
LINWEFVDARAADQATDAGDAVIVLAGRAGAGAVELGHPHRAELVDPEQAVVAALSLLLEEDRAPVFERDEEGHGQQERREEQGGAARDGKVHRALGGATAQAQRPGRDDQRPGVVDAAGPSTPMDITVWSMISPVMFAPLRVMAHSMRRSGGQLTSTRSMLVMNMARRSSMWGSLRLGTSR